MSKLDKEIERDLRDSYGQSSAGPQYSWRYCFNCLKMQKHELFIIVGIAEDVCTVCQTEDAVSKLRHAEEEAVFRLKERPR